MFFMPKKIIFLLIVVLFFSFLPSAQARKFSAQYFQRRLQETKIQNNLVSFEAKPFDIFTEKELPDSMKRAIKKMVENTVRSVGAHYAYYPAGKAQLSLLQGAVYESIDDPEVSSSGFYRNKKIRMLFDYQQVNQSMREFELVFRHEYTHLVIASIDGGKTPRWLNEGLAVYEERGRAGRKRGEGRVFYQSMKSENKLIPIRDFVSIPLREQYGKRGTDFYAQSYVLAKYLADRYGYSKIRQLLNKLKEGYFFSQALEAVCGIDLEKLAKGAYES